MPPVGFPASQDPQAALDWTAANANHLVKAVSRELAQFPGCDEVLFLGISLKKWRFASEKTAEIRRESAITGFFERNRRAGSLSSADRITREAMRRLLREWLPFVGVKPGRFGPGSVAERRTHARRWEVLSPWLTRHYSEGHIWSRDDAVKGSELYLGMEGRDADHDTSRLCAVPKDWNKDRLITVEPSMRSFMQQAVRTTLIESVHAGPLRGSAMDLFADGQAIQRKLALRASYSREYSTLDLSDASDNITAEFISDVFPPWVVTLLDQCRSPYFTADGQGREALNIYAGMGNATTFVIETLLFAAYCRAIAWRHGLKRQVVSVFGDDIIVSSPLHRALVDMNDDFFRINPEKSFGPDDSLRESCGIYALNGHDVTPARINGFERSYAGLLGACEYVRQNCESNLAYRYRLGIGLAKVLLSKGLVRNWPFRIEGYPSISRWELPFDELPETRIHKDWQIREARVAIPSPLNYQVPTNFSWALQGALAGALSTRAGNTRLVFPSKGGWTAPRKRWCRVVSSD
jgi:hypothetical protein